jgi:hypothetical protein
MTWTDSTGKRHVERFTEPGLLGADTDAWDCPCGNTPRSDGFVPSSIDAVEVEPNVGGAWDGRLYACARCGRVADVTREGSPVVAGPQEFVPLPVV